MGCVRWLIFLFVCSSEMCGDLDSLELGDTVEYTLSKGKGNKVSAEKVTKVAAGMNPFCRWPFIYHTRRVWGEKSNLNLDSVF